MNNSESVPFSFHIYATFDVMERLTDKKLHNFIDTLNPELRSKEKNVRVFDDTVKRVVYEKQTQDAKNKGISNCPLCALGNDSNKVRIWELKELEAYHVTAWSKGGSTEIDNCQMLCQTHNRAK